MLALTLWRPWDYAIAKLGKTVENRSWRPPPHLIGQRIAIHSGLRYDEAGARWLAAHGRALPLEIPVGRVVCTTRVVGWVQRIAGTGLDSSFVGEVPEGYDLKRMLPWFAGPMGWLLADTVPVQIPTVVRGRQGFWPLPVDVAAEARRQSGVAA